MNPALRASAAHIFVDSLESIELSQDDAHHLLRVLRLRDGESVTVSDGQGSWRACAVAADALRPVGDVVFEPANARLTIASAIPKGDRLEWMVQKLTELGVDEIVLLHCERSVVRWKGDRGAQQLTRLTRVAREAAMQSRRVWLPTVRGPVDFAEAAALPGTVVADPDGAALTMASVVLIGPEGGLTEAERELCAQSVNLGRNILRVETAAVAAAAILGCGGR
ncbi:MAG: 16S rRNA (uracil(1498)-N(3))-methyltransferase [Actinomycetia bacterium]|nr:16S rRNA (uracil(1498)-N(3))-methyltransferase [Actinomycetes bacterium]